MSIGAQDWSVTRWRFCHMYHKQSSQETFGTSTGEIWKIEQSGTVVAASINPLALLNDHPP